jgi:hypothetical protein
VRTLLYEAANVMLTRYKGQLKLKDESLWLAASRSSCTRRCETGPSSRRPKSPQIQKTGGRIQLP